MRRNRRDLGLFNGQFITMNNVIPLDDLTALADVTTDTGETFLSIPIYTGRFMEPDLKDEERKYRDFRLFERFLDIDYAYALTCHLAQGSGFHGVCVFDDGWGFADKIDRKCWLYTAITRASETLVILGK
jgi:exodeoxyribonuclease-5